MTRDAEVVHPASNTHSESSKGKDRAIVKQKSPSPRPPTAHINKGKQRADPPVEIPFAPWKQLTSTPFATTRGRQSRSFRTPGPTLHIASTPASSRRIPSSDSSPSHDNRLPGDKRFKRQHVESSPEPESSPVLRADSGMSMH